jgi:hypothetical protein
VLLCLRRVEAHLDDLRRIYGLARAGEALEVAEYLREFLTEKPISHILATGLHHYLDVVQIHIQDLAGTIGRSFFRDWQPAALGGDAPAEHEAQSQLQTQGAVSGSAAPPGGSGGGMTEASA